MVDYISTSKIVSYAAQGAQSNTLTVPKVVGYTVTTPDGNNEQIHVYKSVGYVATGFQPDFTRISKVVAYVILNTYQFANGTSNGVAVASGDANATVIHDSGVGSSHGVSTVFGSGISQVVNNIVANQITVKSTQFRRGTEAELPGVPKGFPPIVFPKSLDVGELAFTTDTSRVLIGHTPKPGDVDYHRLVFPYQNIEVLTETSPRMKELFDHFVRNQNQDAFFPPTVITGNYNGPITYSDVTDIPVIPSKIYGANVSAAFEYHAFKVIGSTYSPLENGTLRILANQYDQSSVSDFNLLNGSTSLQFSVGSAQSDGGGTYYMLNILNLTLNNISLYMRRIVIS